VAYNETSVRMGEMNPWPEAEVLRRKSLALLQNLVAKYPAVPQWRSSLALAYMNLGLGVKDDHRLQEAEDLLRQPVRLAQELADEFPEVAEFRARLAGVHHWMGAALMSSGETHSAENHFDESIRLRERFLAESLSGPSPQRESIPGPSVQPPVRAAVRVEGDMAERVGVRLLRFNLQHVRGHKALCIPRMLSVAIA
jgi:tetratricopeptide (TPR) repeat protein